MSIDSALIVRKESLPTTTALAEAIAQTGSTVVFPPDFRLDETPSGWVAVQIDGETSGFEYSIEAVADLEEDLPARARKHGDTLLSFGARGSLSAETVSLIQHVMADRWKAAGWIDEELVPPAGMAREAVPSADMDPDLAATMRGTPAERAAAIEAYVGKFYPPRPTPVAPPITRQIAAWLRGHLLEFGIFVVALAALILWKTLT